MLRNIILFSVTFAGVLTLEPSAFAQGELQIGTRVFSPAEADAADAYWTPEQMQNAIPMPLLEAEQGVPTITLPATISEPEFSFPAVPPGIEEPASPIAADIPGGDQTNFGGAQPDAFVYPYPFTRFSVLRVLYDESLVFRVAQPYRTIGKLFFRLNGSNFVCSASVARPHLVLTARHCIYSTGTGRFADNVRFFPAWHSGPNGTLHGVWRARTLATFVNPTPPQTRFDIGFIQTFDDDGVGCGGSMGGHPIEFYTGHLGVSWGGSYAQRQWNEFGYPAAAPFAGQIMVESQSSTGALDPGGRPETIELGNDMTGGSSGGPWIRGFDPGITGVGPPPPPANPGGNAANGLNSAEIPGHPMATLGPQFLDGNFGNILRGAESLPCP